MHNKLLAATSCLQINHQFGDVVHPRVWVSIGDGWVWSACLRHTSSFSAHHVRRTCQATLCTSNYRVEVLYMLLYHRPGIILYPYQVLACDRMYSRKTRGKTNNENRKIASFGRPCRRDLSVHASLGVWSLPVAEKPAFKFVRGVCVMYTPSDTVCCWLLPLYVGYAWQQRATKTTNGTILAGIRSLRHILYIWYVRHLVYTWCDDWCGINFFFNFQVM